MATFLRCVRIAATTGTRMCKLQSSGPVSFVQRSRNFCYTAVNLSDRKFTEGHEWVQVEGNIGTIGISDHAQTTLGDIVFVELPEEGSEFEKDDECGVVESVKAVSDIKCPVSGTIKASNSAVVEEPCIINKDCYRKGWLFKVEMTDKSEVDGLMDEAAYQAFLDSQ